MNIDQLIDRLRYPLRKVDIVEYSKIFAGLPNGDELLFNLALGDDAALQLHAAWVFELVVLGSAELQVKWFYPIICAAPQVTNQSVRRFFAKILKSVLGSARLRSRLHEELHPQEFQQLAEVCFEWMLAEGAIVSVQAQCVDVLVELVDTNCWVRKELLQVVSSLAADGGAAIRCKLKPVRAKCLG